VEYQVRPSREAVAAAKIDSWLERDDLAAITVQRIGSKADEITIPGSEMNREELEYLGSGGAVVSAIVDTHGSGGGTLQARARFEDDADGKPKTPLRVRIPLVRAKAPASGSSGSSAATEALGSSMANLVDGLGRRQEELVGRFMESLGDVTSRTDELGERRLAEHSTFMQEIMRLHAENANLRMELALASQVTGMPPEAWELLIKEGVPMVGVLVSAVKTAAQSLGKPDPGPENGAPELPQGAEPGGAAT
jgi:hypothetical protein